MGSGILCFWENPILNQIDLSDFQYSEKMVVPAAFDAMPAYAGKRGTACYRKVISISPGTYARLQFEAVSMWCRIYIDGVLLTEHRCGYSGFWCDLPLSEKTDKRTDCPGG